MLDRTIGKGIGRMEAASVLIVFFIFIILEYGSESALTLLNIAYLKKRAGTVPAAFAPYVDEAASRKAAAYTIARGRLSLLAGGVNTIVIVIFILTGLFGAIDRLTASLFSGIYLHGLFFILCISFIFSFIGLPFALYGQFVIEERFGFNKMTIGLFFKDRLKAFIINGLIGAPLLLGLFFFMEKTGPWWWLFAFGAFTLFQLIVSFIYPTVIAPLFNKFTPLPDGPLKEKIDTLLESLGYRVKGIFVMDGSKRSRHSNAYFTGLGRVKRIVLFDTLMKVLSDDEIVAVFAHELGHEKRGHVWKNTALGIAGGAVAFFVLSLLLHWTPLYLAFGFARPSYHALLVILSVCAGPFTFFLRPLVNAISRAYEYAADRFAKDALGGDGAHLASALITLTRDNLSNLHPHPLYSFIYYSHPTPVERIAALEK